MVASENIFMCVGLGMCAQYATAEKRFQIRRFFFSLAAQMWRNVIVKIDKYVIKCFALFSSQFECDISLALNFDAKDFDVDSYISHTFLSHQTRFGLVDTPKMSIQFLIDS